MRFSALLLAGLFMACAPTYYDSYRAEQPDWVGDVPRKGATLHETLAGLYAPPVADYSRFISKLDVVRLEDGGSIVLASEEIHAAIAEDTPGDYGVVAIVRCQSKYNLKRYMTEKVAWYLLLQGKLVAYDHYDFVDLCTVFNEFVPARADALALEELVISHRDANFPKSMEHTGQFYSKGLAYLAAKRTEDARRMLMAGDAALDVGSRGERHQDYESSTQIRTSQASDVQRIRERLVVKLQQADAPAE